MDHRDDGSSCDSYHGTIRAIDGAAMWLTMYLTLALELSLSWLDRSFPIHPLCDASTAAKPKKKGENTNKWDRTIETIWTFLWLHNCAKISTFWGDFEIIETNFIQRKFKEEI